MDQRAPELVGREFGYQIILYIYTFLVLKIYSSTFLA